MADGASQLLQALQGALQLLSEVRCGVEGGTALLRHVNADLEATLRRLQQQQQQQLESASQHLRHQLPAGFVALQQEYHSMRRDAATSSSGPVTSQAAAGFLQGLEAAYGGPGSGCSDQQQQQQVAAQAFADQASFAGLVSAVLSAVQGLTDLSNASSSRDKGKARVSPNLAQAVPALLAQCDQWLQGQGQTSGQQQQQQHAEMVRFRNRALRSLITAPAPTGSEQPPQAACLQLPGLWLPQSFWRPLEQQGGGEASRSSNSSRLGLQRVLLPPVSPSSSLVYSQLAEVVLHSKMLHKVQHLLLQLAVESQAAPQLLQVLLRCCQQLQSAPGAAGVEASLERCCALYRLLCALTSGPVKQRGLGAGCQLAVEAEAPY